MSEQVMRGLLQSRLLTLGWTDQTVFEGKGFTPTPRRPILPVAIARLAMAMTVDEPWLCSVTPKP